MNEGAHLSMVMQAPNQDEGPTTTTSSPDYWPTGATSDIDEWRALAGSVGLALLVLLSGALVIAVATRIWRIRRSRQLVVRDFVSGVGDDLPTGMEGFTAVARDRLADRLRKVDRNLKRGGFITAQDEVKSPLPRAVTDTRVTELLTSIETISSAKVGGVAQVITELVAPARGVTVTGHVVRRGSEAGPLGLVLTLSDNPAEAPRGRTWWEVPERPPEAPVCPELEPTSGPTVDEPPQLEIARQLCVAGRYAEAASMASVALERRPDWADAIKLHSRAVRDDSVQRASIAHYSLGATLRARDQHRSAVPHLLAPLPSGVDDARRAWHTALGLEIADRSAIAAAWLKLAKRYDADDVLLHEEALAMLAEAARHSSRTAEQAASGHRARRARALVGAGELAQRVGMLAEAEKYAGLAERMLPSDIDGARLRTAIAVDPRRTKPAKVRSALSAGRVYEELESWSTASTTYLAALEEKPDENDAIAGLRRAASPQRSVTARALMLLGPGMAWLSVEVTRNELEATLRPRLNPRPYRLWRRYRARLARAQVENFAGLLYQSHGWDRPGEHGQIFLDLAIERHRAAIAANPRWPVAHESLGDTLARRSRHDSGDRHDRWLLDARRSYLGALELLQPDVIRPWTRSQELEAAASRHRIGIAIGRAALRMQALPTSLQEEACRPALVHPFGWSEYDEQDADLLYNLASLYGLAALRELIGAETMRRGRRLVACSIVRDRIEDAPLLDAALIDEDIRPLFGKEIDKTLGRFGVALARAQGDPGNHASAQGATFAGWLDEVLRSAGWEV